MRDLDLKDVSYRADGLLFKKVNKRKKKRKRNHCSGGHYKLKTYQGP